MRILHAIHDFLPRHRAGSEIYAHHLAKELSTTHHVTVLCAEYEPAREHASVRWRLHDGLPVVEIVNNWTFGDFRESYRPPRLNQTIAHVLTAVRPDVVHIHNLLNLSMDLPSIARARGIPSVATLHDYTLLCPSGGQRVHVAEHHVCEVIDTARCSRCFPDSPFAAQMSVSSVTRTAVALPFVPAVARYARRRLPRWLAAAERRVARHTLRVTEAEIAARLATARDVFEHVDVFVAPSAALADEYERAGLARRKLRVSDYGFRPLARQPATSSRRLRIGFVGTLVWHKGVHVLIDALRALPSDRVDLRIFGSLDTFPAYVDDLRRRAEGLPVSFEGGFEETNAANVYADLDVLVVPSLWPENSPLVIHEAFMAGVPVIGSRQGGIPELVSDGVNGLIYESTSSEALAAALRRLVDNPALIETFRARLPTVKTIAEDAASWNGIYEEVVSAHRTRAVRA